MMASAECSLVRRKVAIGGGTASVIRAIASSEMTPGPLGMAETRPNAEAPQAIASAASAGDLMQQILTLGRVCTGVSKPPNDPAHRPPSPDLSKLQNSKALVPSANGGSVQRSC